MEIERVFYKQLNNMELKTIKIEIFFYIAFLFVCIFALLQSPLAPFAKSGYGIDSSVYIYSARQILNGQTMYKDIVDHKGPFLYLINAAALFIFNGKFIGIWIFEIISLFVASVMMYKTARFFASKISSFYGVVTSLLFLTQLIIGGNNVEEWALPFISVGMYIFVAYLKRNKPLNIIRLLILSLTFVLTFMIRPNMIALWGGFGIGVLIKWIIEAKYKELIRNLSFLLLFVLLFILPFFLYFYYKDALSDAIYLVFKFNMFEYGTISNISIIKICTKILGGLYYLSVIPIVILIYMFLRNRTIIIGSVLFAFAFTAYSCSLGGGRLYEHYFLIFIPLLVIPYSFIFGIIKDSFPKTKHVSLFVLFCLYNYIPSIVQAQYIVENYSGERFAKNVMPPSKRENLINTIILNSKPEDKILVRGYQSSIYLYSGRTCATRFPYPQLDSSLVKKEYVKDAENASPTLIIQGDLVNSPVCFRLDSLLNEKYRLLPIDVEGVEVWKLNN